MFTPSSDALHCTSFSLRWGEKASLELLLSHGPFKDSWWCMICSISRRWYDSLMNINIPNNSELFTHISNYLNMKTCTAHCSVWQEPVWSRRLVILSMSVLPFPGTSWDYRIVQNLTKQECQWNTVHLELQTTVIRHASKSQRRFKHPNVWDYHAGSKNLVALRIRIPCHQCLALKTAPQMLGLSHIKTFRDIEHELETSSMHESPKEVL